MKITENRLKHSLTVANTMKKIVEDQRSRFSISPNDAFVLGFNHDIGYEFVERKEDHGVVGVNVLKMQGYKYWREVFHHGNPESNYIPDELDLLNYADMTTDGVGNSVTMEERIEDISRRYGDDSMQVKNARKIAESLMERMSA